MAPSVQTLNYLKATLRIRPNSTFANQIPIGAARIRYASASTQPAACTLKSLGGRRAWIQASDRQAAFGTRMVRGYKTVQEAKARSKMGPATPIAIILFLGSGVGMYYYFLYEKERMERVRIAEHSKGVGKPKVGGNFELVDHDGKAFSSEQMKGRYSLVYFGFSHCPDICPEELDKMSSMLSLVEAEVPSGSPRNPDLLPIFITCDPARDTPAVLKAYLKEFDTRIIGLTGAWQKIKDVCKLYRVYFSTPNDVKPGMDYLVDHSIYFYLMDPEGDFVEAIGRQHTPEAAAELIVGHMKDWKGPIVKQ